MTAGASLTSLESSLFCPGMEPMSWPNVVPDQRNLLALTVAKMIQVLEWCTNWRDRAWWHCEHITRAPTSPTVELREVPVLLICVGPWWDLRRTPDPGLYMQKAADETCGRMVRSSALWAYIGAECAPLSLKIALNLQRSKSSTPETPDILSESTTWLRGR
ncbi:hypothetical protein NDU88_005739 [Pleurodeles waltl]|uniref:Uncharacterized protein n=1 Tax=Pleurodeles waltl TaxID=8319 RepID=A0AAV7VJU6_PLEWA|nr:hypothetical protein NDU88_005739 [Pleurodeles waltl]